MVSLCSSCRFVNHMSNLTKYYCSVSFARQYVWTSQQKIPLEGTTLYLFIYVCIYLFIHQRVSQRGVDQSQSRSTNQLDIGLHCRAHIHNATSYMYQSPRTLTLWFSSRRFFKISLYLIWVWPPS